jgi:hypothetical protein
VGLRFIDPLPLETRASLRAIVALRGKDEGAP